MMFPLAKDAVCVATQGVLLDKDPAAAQVAARSKQGSPASPKRG
jgi:hypothetical protein